MSTPAAYLRIAAELRSRITTGDLPAGGKLPTEAALMQQYGVSNTVIKRAVEILKSEGLVEGRRGSGIYVRTVRRLVRHGHARDQRTQPGSTSPFARDAAAAGHTPTWEHTSEHTTATTEVAARLHLAEGEPVMVTRYRFLADGEPIQLSTSWEPLELTGGTAVEWPEDCGIAGVVARMDSIGIRIDRAVERVSDRAASPEEIEALGLGLRGAHLLTIRRTYFVGERPVETADIVLPASRYEVVYELPIY